MTISHFRMLIEVGEWLNLTALEAALLAHD
jgi:hypothetical protein